MLPLSLMAKRGLPVDLTGLRACSATYSQCGEDAVIASLFSREEEPQYYLDLGCYHPMKWSNTYLFYRRGWRGVCVDASNLYAKDWQKFRPQDNHIMAAVVPTANHRVIEFNQETGSAATSFVKTEQLANYNSDANPANMASVAITELANWWTFSTPPEIISSDLEGLDEAVWMSFPFGSFRPRVIIIEVHNFFQDLEKHSPLRERLEKFNYKLYAITGPSIIYLRSD